MRYIFLPAAKADLERLHAFLDAKNPDAAARAVETILTAAEMLLDNPLMGRAVETDNDIRQVVVRFGQGAYIIHYGLDGDTILVTRIWHSREDRA